MVSRAASFELDRLSSSVTITPAITMCSLAGNLSPLFQRAHPPTQRGLRSSISTLAARVRCSLCSHQRGSSCAWMPASTSGGYSASALVVEIRSYDAKQYDRYEHPTPTAEGGVDS